MPTVKETVDLISAAATWDERVNRIRQIAARHGTNDLPTIHAQVARRLYVPHLAPDYAYIPDAEFYGEAHFQAAYDLVARLTNDFAQVDPVHLATVIAAHPTTLLVLRTITGLSKSEFSATTILVAEVIGANAVSVNKVDSMERTGTATTAAQAQVLAETVCRLIDRSLFGDAPAGWRVKQDKPDTSTKWEAVRNFAADGVPYSLYLHQRHYGGAWRQVLDATSVTRGAMSSRMRWRHSSPQTVSRSSAPARTTRLRLLPISRCA